MAMLSRKNRKRKHNNDESVKSVKKTNSSFASNSSVQKKVKWSNKERVLVFCSRGVSFRERHLAKDFLTLMPHTKTDSKMDRKDKLFLLNEICEMKNCNKVLFFESKKKKDLYMWASNTPRGPSAKFLVENINTMKELKMTGNCLKGSRPLLSFSKDFDAVPHWKVLKELFIQIFSTPQYHPKSQPFTDHVFTFCVADNHIWFRNYQILEEDGALAEIGPRLVLNPIKIFEGSFGGPTLYQNSDYVTPNQTRQAIRLNRDKMHKYKSKMLAKESLAARRADKSSKVSFKVDPTEDIFNTDFS